MTVRQLQVHAPQGWCASLSHDASGYWLSTPGTQPTTEVCLSMPHRARPYESRELPPIFQMNLPEGRVLEAIRYRLAKTTAVDPMLLLSLTGAKAPIGRLRCLLDNDSAKDGVAEPGESLAQILAWDGAQDLFDELFDKYVMSSGISGVQPKVLVPEATLKGGKVTTLTNNLIVKSGQDEFPHLAVNEFVCMSIAREAGLRTPEFFLSDNRQLFVMRRFDRTADGAPLGFEDFAVLTGRTPLQKYEGSYEMVAKAVRLYADAAHLRRSLRELFSSVALSCMLGNGDAHLKNFGLTYTWPGSGDVQLSPAFDIVNTTLYLPGDTLALKLAGGKSIFAARLGLVDLARACEVSDPAAVIDTLIEAAHVVVFTHHDLLKEAPGLEEALMHGVHQFEQGFPRG
ncbi:type II toxin-antitoxin system HipA family toxin [Azohydromonas lata]|uniref:type II toxin-antitoxin system HipA family toxin n=1 Tax=Azohydromonas lata TaxID=45677 RepID=UPI000833DBE9|nr:type II toxin-antitoxin system HipA family toxin [Azohydromonas lata]